MILNEQKLSQAESAIEQLAYVLGITEKEIVAILEHGMGFNSQIAGQLSNTNKYFLEEMKATFDCY